VRSLAHDHHTIFYEVLDGNCVILRVLNHRRDVTSAFPP
jgi:plasmid stabilization system protein ParE